MAPIFTRLSNAFGFGAPSGGGEAAASLMSATGGTEFTTTVSGIQYKVHSFYNSSNFVVNSAGVGDDYTRVDWLVVGAGGGGGGDSLGNQSGQGRGCGGGGGGRSNCAQAGGRDPEAIEAALAYARDQLVKLLA